MQLNNIVYEFAIILRNTDRGLAINDPMLHRIAIIRGVQKCQVCLLRGRRLTLKSHSSRF